MSDAALPPPVADFSPSPCPSSRQSPLEVALLNRSCLHVIQRPCAPLATFSPYWFVSLLFLSSHPLLFLSILCAMFHKIDLRQLQGPYLLIVLCVQHRVHQLACQQSAEIKLQFHGCMHGPKYDRCMSVTA